MKSKWGCEMVSRTDKLGSSNINWQW
jgi:hypothetical protein